jgi:hypothetical protein
MERERRVVPRRRLLAQADLTAAAAQRLPLEVTGACRFSLPPLGPLTHAEDVSELLIWYPLAEDEYYQLCEGEL